MTATARRPDEIVIACPRPISSTPHSLPRLSSGDAKRNEPMIRIDLNNAASARLVRLPRWASWLVMAGAFVVGVLIFLVAASLALILVPLVIAGGAFAAWQMRRRMRAAGINPDNPFERRQQDTARGEIVDAEYRVIEPGDRR
jgi:uncharacterized membrane protein